MATIDAQHYVQYMRSVYSILRKSLLTDLSEVSHTSQVSPEFDCGSEYTPSELTSDEKKECVLSDPKFGMFSMFVYTLQKHRSDPDNVYCSRLFTPICALPIFVFCAQWMMFVSVVKYQYGHYDTEICPQSASIESKILMCATSMIYFVNSFFLWDDVVDRTHRRKMIPSVSLVVMVDSFQEFSFSLCVYVFNILIIMNTENVVEMLFNCLALEFVMSLDNEFERMYFQYNPIAAVDIYDNIFVHSSDNTHMVQDRMEKSTQYRICRYITWLPFKILTILFILLPVFCFVMIFIGPFCK